MATQQRHPSFHLATVKMGCADAEAMADFYRRLLGWEVTCGDDDFVLMQDPAEKARDFSAKKRVKSGP